MTRREAVERVIGALDLLNELCLTHGILFNDVEFMQAVMKDAEALHRLGVTTDELDRYDRRGRSW